MPDGRSQADLIEHVEILGDGGIGAIFLSMRGLTLCPYAHRG